MAPDDLPPGGGRTAPGADPEAAAPGARQTLAMRLAARNHQRALRAERLARLRAPAGTPAGTPSQAGQEEAADAAGELEEFLRTLTADLPPLPEGPPIEPGELVPFQRPEAPPPGDLDRLPGVGPGLVWALERAGLRRLADIAPLAPAELAERLGALGRLVPADRWIAAAREATEG
jgi:predicted flap endonuclease-1-like 5' DNA nuclease